MRSWARKPMSSLAAAFAVCGAGLRRMIHASGRVSSALKAMPNMATAQPKAAISACTSGANRN